MNRIHTYKNFLNEASKAELEDQKKSLTKRISNLYRDMENDPDVEPTGGPVADRYGKELNDLEERLEKIKKELASKMKKPTKELTYEEAAYKDIIETISKKAEDIKNSRKAWPSRTIEQEAEIYKKRYGITGDVAGVIYALKKLEGEKKI